MVSEASVRLLFGATGVDLLTLPAGSRAPQGVNERQ
jgi:hypothetical protein